YYLLGGLVAAQRDEGRLAYDTAAGPLGKLDLAHQLWLHPGGGPGIGDLAAHRLAGAAQLLQLGMQLGDLCLTETGAHATGVTQPEPLRLPLSSVRPMIPYSCRCLRLWLIQSALRRDT